MKIKCPACKASIKFQPGQDSEIICLNCETKYSRKKIEAALARRKASTNKPPPASAISITTSADKQQTNSNEPTDHIPGMQELKAISPDLIRTRSRKKNRRRYLLAGLTLICLALSIALVIVFRKNVSPDLIDTPVTESVAEIINDAEPDDETEDLSEIATSQPKTDWSKIPFGLLDHKNESDSATDSYQKTVNRIKSAKILNDCWYVVKPYLLELQADTPSGPSFATGILIDSRGWILTSYRAMHSANTIHVRRARKSVTDQAEIINDTVRGVIATDPEKDLVILSINRRLVDTFEDLPILTEDNLVQSEYVVQCQSPTVLFSQSTIESRVLDRITVEQTSQLDTARLKQQLANPDIRWIRHQHQSPLRVGAPLVDDSGNLVAMNTGFRTSNPKDILAIPSTHIAKFKSAAEDLVQPLPVGTDGEPDLAAAVNNLGFDGVNQELDDTLSSGDLVERLNRLGHDCELFGWKAVNENDEIAFRRFVDTLVALKQTLQQESDSDAFAPIAEQFENWQQKIDQALGVEAELSAEFQSNFNRKYAVGTKGRPLIGYTYVKYAALESPQIGIEDPDNKQDSVVFELKGTDQSIITNLDPEWPPMPPDSPWLVIGQPIGGTVRLVNRAGDREDIQMSKILTVIQSN